MTETTLRVVTCKLCGESLTLTPDCEETRRAAIDPHQQMRRHLASHLFKTGEAGRVMGWLTDMLCFSSDDPERWREQCIQLLDAYLKQNGVKPL